MNWLPHVEQTTVLPQSHQGAGNRRDLQIHPEPYTLILFTLFNEFTEFQFHPTRKTAFELGKTVLAQRNIIYYREI